MTANLLFRRPRDPAARDIVFGRPAGGMPEGATGRLVVTLPSVGLRFAGRLAYDNAVSRSDIIEMGSRWQAARPVEPAQLAARHAAAAQLPRLCVAPWGRGEPVEAVRHAVWRQASPVRMSGRLPWRPGQALPAGLLASAWQTGLRTPRGAAAPWQPAIPVPASITRAPSRAAIIVRRAPAVIPWGAGLPVAVVVRAHVRPAIPVPAAVIVAPWQWAAALRPGRTSRPVTPPPEPWRCYTPPPGSAAHLLFDERRHAGADILFACGRGTPGGSITVPILRTYIVINNVTLVRLPDNTALQAYSLSLKWDIDSWSVGWSASLPTAVLDAVMPSGSGEPVELLATINGTPVRLLAESIARDRRFGDARLNVGGRGRVAWLTAPYAPTVARGSSSAMTSQQIAADALTDNGVPIGWSLDWQISDWLVPGGVWSHQGTMIDAVKRIAEAAGGYVLGHRTDQTLHVRPRYPLLPWEWGTATPDLIIPAAVASTEAIRWSESPAYNRVFVAGQEQGRTGQITRAGTAGDILAPMVTDPLITHADAARARGASILAAGGRQAAVTLRLPVLPETGILDLGQLIEYHDGSTARRGLVRSVAVDVARPAVWQTVEIETHA